MGKSKIKKPKQVVEASPLSPSSENVDSSSGPVKAIDGHNTTGWHESEIKAYNELIVERQKLERQRHELEEKCAKSQTQRALLHENVANIDSMFKQQKSTSAAYKFTGSSDCCVDLDANANCHHEICKRAKTEGVTDNELDTIKYYSMRVYTEKSERIRSALRKQRDLELVRIKKEDEEGLAQSVKKSSKKSKSSYGDAAKLGGRGSRSNDMTRAAKETEKIVNKIINQLDDLRSDLQLGRISAEEAQGKLNILDSKLPVMQDKIPQRPGLDGTISSMTTRDIKSTTESFQTHLRDRLLSAKGDTFSQAFSIMDHFLSATKPDDLQEAISELKDVLQLSGPMCDELQNSLGALEGIFDSPDKLSFTGPDGKQECTSIIDLMEKLKETLKRTGQLPDGANASLTKVFQECIDLEAEAKEQLTRKCGDEGTTSAQLPATLTQIKDEFVAKSPIPPLTSNKLDIDIANLLDVYDARQLLAKSRAGIEPTQLEAQITSLVISRTQRKSAKYLAKLDRLDLACRSAREQDGADALREAISNVMDKMKKFIPGTGSKDTKPAVTDDKPREGLQPSPALHHPSKSRSAPNTNNDATSQRPGPTAVPPSPNPDAIAKQIRTAIEGGGKHGMRTVFETYSERTFFEVDRTMLDKAESYKGKTRTMIEDQAFGLKSTVCYLYKLKLCPGLVAAIVSQALLEIAESSEDDCQIYMKDLSGCVNDLPGYIQADWSATFQHLTLAMIQLYVATYVEAVASFPKTSALYLAINTVEMATKFVLLTRTPQLSYDNLKVLAGFLSVCFSHGTSLHNPSLQSAITHYRHFCVTDTFKCTTTSSCSKHISFVRMPFKPEIVRTKAHVGTRKSQTVFLNTLDEPPKPTVELPSVAQAITPTKTTIIYPLGHPNEPHHAIRTKSKTTHNNRRLKEALLWHDAVLKKSLALRDTPIEPYIVRRLPPPEAFLAAIDDISDGTVTNFAYATPVIQNSSHETASTKSKFSEHLDEAQHLNYMPSSSVAIIQNVFRYLERRTFGHEYDSIFQEGIRERVMSGRYPDPCDAVSQYVDSLEKIGPIPDTLERTFISILKGVEGLTLVPESQILYETRRLKYLLRTTGADEPDTNTLLDLAVNSPQVFDEYHEIITDRSEQDDATRLALEQLWSAIKQLTETTALREDSPSLIQYSTYVLEDWRRRPSVTTYFSKAQDGSWSETVPWDSTRGSILEREIGDSAAAIPRSLGFNVDGASGPAKLSTLNRPKTVPGVLENSAPHQSTALVVETATTAIPGTTPMIGASFPMVQREAYQKTNGEQAGRVASDEQQQISLDATVKPVASVKSNAEDTEAEGPRYLLPDGEPMTNGHSSSTGTMTTAPASFRMLDMMRHLTTLQGSSRSFVEAAKEVTRADKDHGKIVQAIADKLAAQIVGYSDFAGQIAEWNGIELAEGEFQATQQPHKSHARLAGNSI